MAPTTIGRVAILLKLTGLAACCAAGLALAGLAAGAAADVTVTQTTTVPTTITETHEQTVTSSVTETQAATVVSTSVLTTTRVRTVPATTPTTTAETAGSSSDIPPWMWVLLGLLLVAVATLAVLLTRGRGDTVSVEERQRRLDGAVATWVAQGWALESEVPGAAVLLRGSERMTVSVDAAGQVTTHPQSEWPTRPAY